MERTVSNRVPEVMILRCIGVAQGDVADHTERDERHLINITRLRDGARLHINGLGFWEVAYNLAHLLLAVHKPVACDDKARLGPSIHCFL